jgi:DNA-binding NarL/FixJ family response regulator
MNANETRILLVEDQPIVRQGLRRLIEEVTGMRVVGEVANGQDMFTALQSVVPDVVVMDIHLARENGLEITRRLLAQFPAVKVVVLSGDLSLDLVREALRSGVSAYVTKGQTPADLVRAIHSAIDHRIYMSPDAAALATGDYLKILEEKTIPASKPMLTGRELRLLQLVAEGKRNKDIAEVLGVGAKSVETYRGRLMKKLGCANANELTRYALREGIASL